MFTRSGTFLVALPGSLALSLTTISIAWLFYRPLIGAPLLANRLVRSVTISNPARPALR